MAKHYPDRVDLKTDILPIFIMGIEEPLEPVKCTGTGFLIADHLLLTCWHCVDHVPEEDPGFYVLTEGTGGANAEIPAATVEKSAVLRPARTLTAGGVARRKRVSPYAPGD